MEQAQELRKLAWQAPYRRGSDGRPDIAGNCLGKALWLRERLGGVVVSGWSTLAANPGHHAVLFFAVDGSLFVADEKGIDPIESKPFFVRGFYFPEER